MGKKSPTSARKHAAVENLEIAGMRFGPTIILIAEDFLSAAKALDGRARWTPARTFLACRAVELSLKAFLTLQGITLETLTGGRYSHDLESLLWEADKQGLGSSVNLDTEMRAEIVRASPYYAEKVFEYPALVEAAAYPKWPETDRLIAAGEVLVTTLRPQCMAAA